MTEKALTIIVDKETYNDPDIRKEIEMKLWNAMPVYVSECGLYWSCLVSLDDPESERWVCNLAYRESVWNKDE
jgi:hypothetical protein